MMTNRRFARVGARELQSAYDASSRTQSFAHQNK